ncbi:MAG TPA: RelA/SpoT family protein [Candidatus Paceibacterota bacterium]|nr:RelA/SpoT family protein [Candidatus Paceibacterota bacterium]HPT18109.1 RelA/SpoT family protein [Candidatus Paceibacterota bacterium]
MTEVEELLNLISGEINKKDEELIRKAYAFSQKAHEGQKRENGDPYFVHVFETAKTIAKFGLDIKTVVAGLLHDVLEDTKIKEEDLEKEFGSDVLFLVKGVTKLGTLKYHGQARHVESLRKFFIAMANDLRVVAIKFADRLHNLKTLEFIREDKRKRIALESIEVYAPLANRLGMGKLKGEIEDAAFPFAYPKEYSEIEKILEEKKFLYKKYLDEIKDTLEKELKKNKIKYINIDYRIKHKYSLYKKLLHYNMDLDKIYDIVALRVIVNTVEECYRVLGIVHSIWHPLPNRIKDYIALPKTNGYRSLHTTIFTGSGGIAEIQIRTQEMHNEAEFGVAAHFIYKENEKKNNTTTQKTKFDWIEELKNLKNNPKKPEKFIEHLKTDFFSDRIFIFTPKGDVIDLPKDSSPIDFAYAIHSDIGKHVSQIKVNSKIAPISTKLKNGDIVEVITRKESNPSGKWLDYVKTSSAKKQIKVYLEKNSLLAKLKSFGKR